jgi:tRNA-dihydrouridine synthase
MKNFWEKLNRPIFALAPMEDVTDTVFRRIVTKASRPDVFFTEFTSVDGLLSKKGYAQVAKRFIYTEENLLAVHTGSIAVVSQ